MKAFLLAFFFLLLVRFGFGQTEPIRLNPENPHYFLYKGKPLALITSAEHYGAILNADFDYKKYLQILHREGMNYTRIFMGSYFEIPSTSFGIKNNTLAPDPGKAIVPWKTVIENGQIKYDWSTYNPVYFERLKAFMTLASELDIIVEVTLFSSIYNDGHWEMNPQNPKNRIGAEGSLDQKMVHTTENGQLLGLQKGYVRKLVEELNGFNNFFFEIQNEPWADRGRSVLNIANKHAIDGPEWMEKVDLADQLSLDWQEQIAEVIANAEAKLLKRHLIAQNYSNFQAPLANISEDISILNFHYNWPESVEQNYHWNRVIGFDESGFAGSEDMVYRRQAWVFLFSGGGLFNSLDYSFFTGKEDGTGQNEAPGGGSTELRKQLSILSKFVHSMDLNRVYPDNGTIKAAPGMIAYALSDGKNGFGIFLNEAGETSAVLEIKVDPGNYEVQSLNTLTGGLKSLGNFIPEDTTLKVPVTLVQGEIALRILKK